MTDASGAQRINVLAFSATLHCLSGCTIGEVLGMVIGTALGWSNFLTAVGSIALAFLFGYSLTIRPVLKAGLAFQKAVRVTLTSDTISIAIMEIVDTAIMFAVPGAMDAHFTDRLFWFSLILSLLIAGIAAYPVNRWLILRGRGHALVHDHMRDESKAHAHH
jgi:hypothetical protein